jgi:hypothetical protein
MNKKIIACIIMLSSAIFFSCSSEKKTFPINQNDIQYYKDSYENSKASFKEYSAFIKNKYKNTRIDAINIPGKTDTDLTVDYCYIPAQKTRENLLIITSGIHGIEGFAGSAVQRMVMNELLEKVDLNKTGVIFIHSMNPWGFKNFRRVTENNVDLNRNSDNDKKIFELKNDGYAKLYDFLNPQDKLSTWSPKYLFFPVVSVYKIVKDSMKALRQAIVQGQYTFEKGIYYGGKNFEPQITAIEKILLDARKDYKKSMDISFHTGYGERGKLHLFPSPIEDKKIRGGMEYIFKGNTIDWGDGDDFYTNAGDFSDYIAKLYKGKIHFPMLIEYGTMDSQTTLGSIKSIKTMIMENQGYFQGYKNDSDKDSIRKEFIEMYYPSSEAWRSSIMKQSRDVMTEAFKRFQELKI